MMIMIKKTKKIISIIKYFTSNINNNKIQISQSTPSQRLNIKTQFQKYDQYKLIPSHVIGNIHRIAFILQNGQKYLNSRINIAGWVKSSRIQASGKMVFLQISDGSSILGLQIVLFQGLKNWQEIKKLKTGCSVKISGKLIMGAGKNHKYEISINGQQGDFVNIYGQVGDKYPLAAKYHKPQTLREIAHLRPRTNLISAISRIKNNLSFATHQFFQLNGFSYIQTPIITTSDCQGAGQMFQVTNLLPQSGNLKDIPNFQGKIDYSKDFFKRKAGLTVSGQLSVQNYCCSLGNVYTFGPTFRAEQSNTLRHAAQFWMIQPELAFADLSDAMDTAQAYIKYTISYILRNNINDLNWLQKLKPNLNQFLKNVKQIKFGCTSYDEAIIMLQKSESKGIKFTRQVVWGMDLGSQHEKYLCENIFGKPTFVYNYPKQIKAFYMRLNEDKKTVASFDLLVPGIGQVIGGSQRQQRLQMLEMRMKEHNLEVGNYWWYLDLRRYGTVPHSGFGVGFQRLGMMATGVQNIRDILSFPRIPGSAQF